MKEVLEKLDKNIRSADAAIKGYTYQFLHTIDHILDQEDDTINVIEGTEDLDVFSSDSKELYQYKYHEFQNITNSLIGKPVGIMFKHFLNNRNSEWKYKLIIYSTDKNNFEIDIKKILVIKSAEKQIENSNEEISDSDYEEFERRFILVKAKKFELLEQQVVEKIKRWVK